MVVVHCKSDEPGTPFYAPARYDLHAYFGVLICMTVLKRFAMSVLFLIAMLIPFASASAQPGYYHRRHYYRRHYYHHRPYYYHRHYYHRRYDHRY